MNDEIPLATVAAELGVTADELAARIGRHVVQDTTTGLRSIPANLCRQLIDERDARVAAEAARREQWKADYAETAANAKGPVRAAVAAAQRRPRIGDGAVTPQNALADVMAADTQRHLDGTPSRRMDAYMRGESYGHSYQRKD